MRSVQEDADRTPTKAAPLSFAYSSETNQMMAPIHEAATVCLASCSVVSLHNFTAKFAHMVPYVDEEGKA